MSSSASQKTLAVFCAETHNSVLLEEWDYEANLDDPTEIPYRSRNEVQWKCNKCHTPWSARIIARTVRGSGCPHCARKVMWENRHKIALAQHNLAIDYPNLAAEWDYEMNAKRPEDFSKGTHESVYWKCPMGHDSYLARIANRVYKGDGCPVCAGRRISKDNNLAVVYPFLAAQWDYERNKDMPRKTPQEVFPREANKYWWICPICKESYWASVSNRSAGKNHKKCSQKGTSFPEQAAFFYVRQLFSDAINRDNSFGFELDIYIPSINSAIEFDGALYHKGDSVLEKDNRKDALCENLGIILYRLRDPALPDTVTAKRISCVDNGRKDNLDAPIKQLLDSLKPGNAVDVNATRDYYEILSATLLSLEQKSIIVTHPELASEWHPTKNLPLTPDKVTSGMGIRIWWRCNKCGEEFPAVVYSRKRGGGCPKCAIEIRKTKRTDAALKKNRLIDMYPELVEEIDLELNPGIDVLRLAAGSKREITWKCKKCGFQWPIAINHRTRGDGCPVCGRESTKKAANRAVINLDTGEIFPSLTAAAESCGGDKRGIYNCCRGKCKAIYGYHWKYQDPSDNRNRHTGMFVRNIETGEIFKTVQAAANRYGCDRTSISAALRGKTKTSQGFHWEYISH